MKKIAKIASLLMCIALLISFVPFRAEAASKSDYVEFKAIAGDVQHGAYLNGLNGKFTDDYYEAEIPELADITLIDNSLSTQFWSKPIKFNDLYDEGGTVIPGFIVNLTRDGKPAENVGGMKFWLRTLWDCEPTHFTIDIATNPEKTNWVTVYENPASNYVWDDLAKIFYFQPTRVIPAKI